MHVVDFVIFGCWVAFWLYWLAASVGAKAGSGPGISRFAGIRVVVILVVLLLVRSGLFKGGRLAVSSPVLQGIGLTLFFMGLALAIWARRYLGSNWGMPMSRKADPELVTTGPYRRVRHPIYSGLILAMVGTTVAVGLYWLVAVVALGGYFVYSATVEERIMASTFPEAYPAYKRSTKMLVPFVF